MLPINLIREQKDAVILGLRKKHLKDAEKLIDSVLQLDQQRREVQGKADSLSAEANGLARQIGELMKSGKKEEAENLKVKTAENKAVLKGLQDQLVKIEEDILAIMVRIPNVPSPQVPEGRTPEENVEVYKAGIVPALSDRAKPHWELIKEYDIIDFELGNKIAGAGFPVYKNKGAKLQRALINFFLDEATVAGYIEIQPPVLVNAASGFATGQLPDKDGQMYHDATDDLYLIPTAEVPITNLYRDVILKEEQLPVKNVGYTPCFRREAGSWGADVRGLNRLHQFDKVEIVQISHPEQSYAILEEMKAHVSTLLTKLELPFRILKLCGGDMSFTSALTFDFEVYSAAQKRWLEVSSVSNFEVYQSNRLKLRYKTTEGKTQLLHTLNGSAMALPRIVAALLENNQTEDGIKLPKVLHSYTGFEKI
ncbi:MAG TPA: serine--tRNA ligase [Cytophagaceae bacterium]|jgi:seryl-tRNA synthetase|nr:serine--tRNA ligase [Cytophagaceae bacterium]